VLSAGYGNDLSKTIEVSRNDQIEIDETIKKILPILRKMDPRLVFAALADIGIKVSKTDKEFS
jgi:hypothetical protein